MFPPEINVDKSQCRCSKKNMLIGSLVGFICAALFIGGVVLTQLFKDNMAGYPFIFGVVLVLIGMISLAISFCVCCCLHNPNYPDGLTSGNGFE